MISMDTHQFLYAKAKQFRVTQSGVIDALRSLVSEELLDAKLKDAVANKGRSKADLKKRRQEATKLAEVLDMETIKKLVNDPDAIKKLKETLGE